MKKIILKNLKVLVIATVALFVTSAFAQITVPNLIYTDTSVSQVKSGSLYSDTFIAYQNSIFNQDVTFDGSILGNPASNGDLNFKSDLAYGYTSMYVNGNMYISDGSLYVKGIQPYLVKPNLPVKLCTNNAGSLVACP